ncbi:unnamed protein product, partial [Didymodactylos carnosus]
MFTLYFYKLPPRIELITKLLKQHWSNYLADKHKQSYDQALSSMAGIFIRRGDKMPEDSFWSRHKHWRNISLYVKAVVDEEIRRKENFTSIFVMTDDVEAMQSIMQYSSLPSSPSSTELFAQKHLRGRQILYNVYAPQACFNPFTRIGYDQFLVNINFLVRY